MTLCEGQMMVTYAIDNLDTTIWENDLYKSILKNQWRETGQSNMVELECSLDSAKIIDLSKLKLYIGVNA